MAVLITGAAGFIGARMVKKMLEEAREVHGLDRVKPGASALKNWGCEIPFHVGSITDREIVFSAVREAGAGPIVHLAGILTAGCDREPEAALAVNVHGMRHVLDAALKYGSERVVLASTIGVYGPGLPQPITEDMPREPEGWYGLTKLMAEEMGMLYARRYGIDFRAARFAAITGAGRSAGSGSASLFTSFIPEKPALGEPYEIEVEENTAYPVVYIRDAVRALSSLTTAKSAPRRVYNIASARIVTAELVDAVKRLIPDARLSYRPDPTVMAVVRGYREWRIDCRRAEEDLGFRPEFDVEAMVRDIIETARSTISP